MVRFVAAWKGIDDFIGVVRIMETFSLSILWHVGSNRLTIWLNIDCKSSKKICLNRVNIDTSGTTSEP